MAWEDSNRPYLLAARAKKEQGLEPNHTEQQALAAEPPLDAAMSIVIHAWQDLDTCRSIGWSLGPIPWVAIASWAEFYEFDHDAAILLTRTIRKLDNHHLETIAARKRLADLK